MNLDRTYSNLALIGFMGTGKSSVGQMLAHEMHFKFLDTDHWIEEQAGASITDIFKHAGESSFRELEAQVVEELGQKEGYVIATGGGLGANPELLSSLKRHSLTVCLWASPETIFNRVSHQSHRPLLRTEDPLGRIKSLLAEREPVYRQADVLINTELRSLREIVHQIVHHFQAGPAECRSH